MAKGIKKVAAGAQKSTALAGHPGNFAGPEPDAVPVDAGSVRPQGMNKKEYRSELAGLQVDMFKLQEWITGSGRPVVVVLEGLGPAGKAATARRIVEGLHGKIAQIVRLEPPRKRERLQWHFQRYIEHFPKAGKLVIFDGSWYHYPAMERALGICGPEPLSDFLASCAVFEQTLTASGVILGKYWFGANPDEQDRRFRSHIQFLASQKTFYLRNVTPNCEPLPVAAVADMILSTTDLPHAAWTIVNADDRREARLSCMRDLVGKASEALERDRRAAQP